MEPTFNEGDAVNFNVWHYGEDQGKYREFIGQKYKDAVGNICTSKAFQTDQLVNAGDVPAIDGFTGRQDGKNYVGKTWKNLSEFGFFPNSKAEYVEVSGPLYTKKG